MVSAALDLSLIHIFHGDNYPPSIDLLCENRIRVFSETYALIDTQKLAEVDIIGDDWRIVNDVFYAYAVSYTHLDVYKRQGVIMDRTGNVYFVRGGGIVNGLSGTIATGKFSIDTSNWNDLEFRRN